MAISFQGYVSVDILCVLPVFISILQAEVLFLFNHYKMMYEPGSDKGNNIDIVWIKKT
jgi:hypothetical protein